MKRKRYEGEGKVDEYIKFYNSENSVDAVIKVQYAEYDSFQRVLRVECGKKAVDLPMSEENAGILMAAIAENKKIPDSLIGSTGYIEWSWIDRNTVTNNHMIDSFFRASSEDSYGTILKE